MSDLLVCQGVGKSFDKGPEHIEVLRDVSFALNPGQSLAIVGQSGSGKSTLLHIVGGLMRPSQGEVRIHGDELFALSDAQRSERRNTYIGFVFQFHHLLPDFTALENVCMPLWIRRQSGPEVTQQAKQLLETVGLGHRMSHKSSELSGGEQQRVAIARALVGRPSLVIADEPTGNLDTQTADKVADLLLDLVKAQSCALVIATHSQELSKRTQRVCRLINGGLHAES